MDIKLITGNQNKLREWQSLFNDSSKLKLSSASLDLDEIQSLNLKDIVTIKAEQAYKKIKRPVIVEDVSAGIESLNWLPGPFIKFFEKELGEDALFQLSITKQERVKITCMVAFFDGKELITAKAIKFGTLSSVKGDNGFGFDKVFIPSGQTKTYAEMTSEEKNKISHRSIAIKKLIKKIEEC